MMHPADRNGELVAHAAPECARLCKGQVVRIRWRAAADKAWLTQYESAVILIAQPNGFTQSTDYFAPRRLLSAPAQTLADGVFARSADGRHALLRDSKRVLGR